MKLVLYLVLLSGSVFAGFLASDKNAFTPDQIPYGPVPAFISAGAQLPVLEGDPTAATGDFTVRLKMPDGYRIPPDWHPNRENVTVILGNFEVGMGDSSGWQLCLPGPEHAPLRDGKRGGRRSGAGDVALTVQLRQP
jgi:hypothetical protein